jgi:hypothetical protein
MSADWTMAMRAHAYSFQREGKTMATSYSRWSNSAGDEWIERTPVVTDTGHMGYDYSPEETEICVNPPDQADYTRLEYVRDPARLAELTINGARNDGEEIID